MATLEPPALPQSATPSGSPAPVATLLVSLPSLPQDALAHLLESLAAALPGQRITAASPDLSPDHSPDAPATSAHPEITLLGYTPSTPPATSWILTASDFLNARELLRKHPAQAVLILGPESQSLSPEALANLAAAVLNPQNGTAADLAVARYDLPPNAGLVNSAILYPVSRALFAASPRYPLALDLGLSPRMLERLATAAQRFTASNQPDALLWPVASAATAGFTIAEVPAGHRTLPTPDSEDLSSLLAKVTSSLFTEVDTNAAWWQRARPISKSTQPATLAPAITPEDVTPMLEAFRLAYGNLHDLWSLVLPPQSLLGLKRLSVAPAASFRMADSLWARILYDFLLAFRLRTINRGHLLGALTPLYLAWVASHILLTASGTDPERHIEAVAAAFEADKPYLVSRWRWPDRFNP